MSTDHPSSFPSQATALGSQTPLTPSASPTTVPEPRGRYLVWLVFILGMLNAFGSLSSDMPLPSLPLLGRDLLASDSQVQLTLSFSMLGFALGQIIVGPLSDTWGRRRPLLMGLALYAVSSLLCTFAPSIAILSGLRLLQGIAGAAGMVLAVAIMRDLYTGVAAARFFSLIYLFTGMSAIISPLIGGLMIHFASWRSIFLTLSGIGIALFIAVLVGFKETLPAERRQQSNMGKQIKIFWQLFHDRTFLRYALPYGLAFAALYAYIAGSPFVLQGIYGVSPQIFSLVFSINGLGLVIVNQVNRMLTKQLSLKRLLVIGLAMSLTGGLLLLITEVTAIGLIGTLPAFFLIVSSMGLIVSNALTLALADHPNVAGSAAALLGVLQSALSAIAMPLVGLAGPTTALPLALVVVIVGSMAFISLKGFEENARRIPTAFRRG